MDKVETKAQMRYNYQGTKNSIFFFQMYISNNTYEKEENVSFLLHREMKRKKKLSVKHFRLFFIKLQEDFYSFYFI